LNPGLFGINIPETKDKSSRQDLHLEEKQLQVQILNLLRLKGIEPLWHRTDKKSTATVGWPDITFSAGCGLRSIPCLWEIKLPGKKLSEEQMSLMVQLTKPPNAWVYKVITSVDEALIELKKLGLTT
jgi:hypothetical protein